MAAIPREDNSVGESDATASSRTEFPSFPYEKPYDIQLQLMRAVYGAVEHGQVGIMESPTGTGKTLSLICSVLQWLLDEHQRQVQHAAGSLDAQPANQPHVPGPSQHAQDSTPDAEPDWLRDYEQDKEREVAARVCAQRQRRLERRRQEREAGSKDVLGPGGIRWQHVAVEGSGQDSRSWWGRGGVMGGGDMPKGKGGMGKGSDQEERGEQGGGDRRRGEEFEEEQFLVPDWESDDDGVGTVHAQRKRTRGRAAAGGGYSSSDSSSDERNTGGALAVGRLGETGASEALADEPLKVFFCSRTHSQLSQFVSELRRTPFSDQLFTVALASRKNLCINSSVLKLGSGSAISERCLELQRAAAQHKSSKKNRLQAQDSAPKGGGARARASASPASSSACGCPYWGKPHRQQQFLHHLVAAPPADIEDLGRLGSRLETCPYYAARAAAKAADVVVLPYQSLLHRGAREALLGAGEKPSAGSYEGAGAAGGTGGTGAAGAGGGGAAASAGGAMSSGGGGCLAGSVVVVDEAHNLTDALAAMHSCQMSARQVHLVQAQLAGYLERFRHKLGAGNRRYVQQLQVVARGVAAVINGSKQPRVQGIDTFLFSLAIDNINLFKLHHYVQSSNIAHKPSHRSTGVTAFRAFSEFFSSLCNANQDGRVLLSPPPTPSSSTTHSNRTTLRNSSRRAEGMKDQGGSGTGGEGGDGEVAEEEGGDGAFVKFVMLNTAQHMDELLASARAIILAGGTLQPLDTMLYQLFPALPPHRLRLFSCGHIVPPESVLPLAVAKGPSGKLLEFTYQSRSNPETIAELGRLLVNVCSVVPGGIVVFFPSFAYLEEVLSVWEAAGSVLPMLAARKAGVFTEPRTAAEVESVLSQYRRCIQGGVNQGGGAEEEEGVKAVKHGGGLGGASQHGSGNSSSSGMVVAQRASKGAPRGAVLLCVVGGKMSEGINFSDDMGRAVLVVGQPFPSPSDPELNERMRFIDRFAGNSSSSNATASIGGGVLGEEGAVVPSASMRSCGSKGRQLYEDICAKAVNQSIGRAIRHSGDYAVILLVDARYTRSDGKGITGKLPNWIRGQLVCTGSFGEVPRRVRQFFKHNEERSIK